jgi:hypothetical protein
MPRKPKPAPDDPEQFKRFIEEARKIGVEADPETFDRVLNKVARSPKQSALARKRASAAPDQTIPSSKIHQRRIQSGQKAKRS